MIYRLRVTLIWGAGYYRAHFCSLNMEIEFYCKFGLVLCLVMQLRGPFRLD